MSVPILRCLVCGVGWVAILGLTWAPPVQGLEGKSSEKEPASESPNAPEAPEAGATSEPSKEDSASPSIDKAPPAAAGGLGRGVLARLNGDDITVDEYASYLVAALGTSMLDQYIDRLLIDEEARRLSVRAQPDEVETALSTRIQRTVESLYDGEEDRFDASLQRRNSSRDAYEARWRQTLYYEILQDKILVKTRQITPEALQREFELAYGVGGVQHVLRHILVVKRPPSAPGVRRSAAEMRARAKSILRELGDGLDFSQAVNQYSDDLFTRRNEGRIPNYRPNTYGPEFHAAVLKLSADQPRSGVVSSPHGVHIVELVERRETKFDDVKADIEKFLRTRAPGPEARQSLVRRLRSAAKIERLDRPSE